MIPVVTVDKEGNLQHQVFNDNLTAVEQINRILLGSILYAQTKLVNDKYAFEKKFDVVGFTDAQLETIKEAAKTMETAVKSAIDTFAAVVADPDAESEQQEG